MAKIAARRRALPLGVAGGRRQQPGEQAQQTGFAAAVGAFQDHRLAIGEREVEFGENQFFGTQTG